MTDPDPVINKLLKSTNGALLDERIKLIYIEDFLTDLECDHLVGLAYDIMFERSVTTYGVNDNRTSTSAYIAKDYDEIIKKITSKVSQLTETGQELVEQFQIVKYEIGQKFGSHWDYFPTEYVKKNGGKQRLYTFFVYLNTVDTGGETEFTQLGLEFKPKKRAALFWENCTNDKIGNVLSMHQGKAPISDLKFGLNIWTNFKD